MPVSIFAFQRVDKLLKVFFDTNILISLFRLSNEDLDSLQKLVTGSKLRKFQLVTTPHLRDEYARYRERAISDGLTAFSYTKIDVQFPPFVRRYDRFKAVSSDLKKLNIELKSLAGEVRTHAEANELLIDEVVEDFFATSEIIDETPEIRSAARLRVEKGNPPRKRGDFLGDSLHWESLLSNAKPFEKLVIVSRDGDFESELLKGQPKEFLLREWRKAAGEGSELIILSSLSDFVKRYAGNIQLDSEFSASFLVEELLDSRSYHRTREIIEGLRAASGLNVSLVSKILEAIDFNHWVGDIIGQDDFQDFISDLYEGFSSSEVGGELFELLGGGYIQFGSQARRYIELTHLQVRAGVQECLCALPLDKDELKDL